MSLIFGLVFLLLAIFVLVGNFILIKKSRSILKQVGSLTTLGQARGQFNKKWESVQVLFKGFKDKSFIQQAFLFFFVLRLCVFNLLVAYLFAHPVA